MFGLPASKCASFLVCDLPFLSVPIFLLYAAELSISPFTEYTARRFGCFQQKGYSGKCAVVPRSQFADHGMSIFERLSQIDWVSCGKGRGVTLVCCKMIQAENVSGDWLCPYVFCQKITVSHCEWYGILLVTWTVLDFLQALWDDLPIAGPFVGARNFPIFSNLQARSCHQLLSLLHCVLTCHWYLCWILTKHFTPNSHICFACPMRPQRQVMNVTDSLGNYYYCLAVGLMVTQKHESVCVDLNISHTHTHTHTHTHNSSVGSKFFNLSCALKFAEMFRFLCFWNHCVVACRSIAVLRQNVRKLVPSITEIKQKGFENPLHRERVHQKLKLHLT